MNKETLPSTPNRVLIIGIITTIILVAFSTYFISMVNASPITNNTPTTTVTPKATPLYDPAQYGVPDTLGGYKVLAVLNPDDVACIGSRSKRIVLQTTEPNVHEYLDSPKPIREIIDYLRQIPGEEVTNWQVEVVGPRTTTERIAANLVDWNSAFSDRPCFNTGGPVHIATATP